VITEKQASLEESKRTDTLLAPFVNSFDRDKLLRLMMSKIYARSIIVYVCDMANFEGSIVPEIFEMVERDHHRLIVVGNKIDALPKGFKIESLQKWVKTQIQKQFKDPENLEQLTVCLTSAKKISGVEKILNVLEKTKLKLQHL
jgi:ribosome biogenesis GTPase A